MQLAYVLGFLIFLFATLVIFVLTKRCPDESERLRFYYCLAMVGASTVAYCEMMVSGTASMIYWDHKITGPFLLLLLGQMAGMSNVSIFGCIVLETLMVISFEACSRVGMIWSWALFGLGVMFLLTLVDALKFEWKAEAEKTTDQGERFNKVANIVIMAWIAYPCIYVAFEKFGLDVAGLGLEGMAYSAFDVLSQVVGSFFALGITQKKVEAMMEEAREESMKKYEIARKQADEMKEVAMKQKEAMDKEGNGII